MEKNIEATKVADKRIVVCNIKHCLNCGNCVTACARRHKDISRHRRAGSTLIGISLIPNLCKVCKEPRCIEACNYNAIERDGEGHIVVTDSCVGCGLCTRACPYNAILLFAGQGEKASFIKKFMSFISSNGHKETIEEKTADEEEDLDFGKTEEILDKYTEGPGSLMAILKNIQDEYKFLPKEALRIVSDTMNIPLTKVYNIVTFYKAFSLEPLGRHSISVCIGTACHVRGAGKVMEELERQLGINAGETTGDRKFTLNSVNCLGACALGPVMVIDGQYFEKVTPGKIGSILAKFD